MSMELIDRLVIAHDELVLVDYKTHPQATRGTRPNSHRLTPGRCVLWRRRTAPVAGETPETFTALHRLPRDRRGSAGGVMMASLAQRAHDAVTPVLLGAVERDVGLLQ